MGGLSPAPGSAGLRCHMSSSSEGTTRGIWTLSRRGRTENQNRNRCPVPTSWGCRAHLPGQVGPRVSGPVFLGSTGKGVGRPPWKTSSTQADACQRPWVPRLPAPGWPPHGRPLSPRPSRREGTAAQRGRRVRATPPSTRTSMPHEARRPGPTPPSASRASVWSWSTGLAHGAPACADETDRRKGLSCGPTADFLGKI